MSPPVTSIGLFSAFYFRSKAYSRFHRKKESRLRCRQRRNYSHTDWITFKSRFSLCDRSMSVLFTFIGTLEDGESNCVNIPWLGKGGYQRIERLKQNDIMPIKAISSSRSVKRKSFPAPSGFRSSWYGFVSFFPHRAASRLIMQRNCYSDKEVIRKGFLIKFIFLCLFSFGSSSYECLTASSAKQSKSLGDLLDMVSRIVVRIQWWKILGFQPYQ